MSTERRPQRKNTPDFMLNNQTLLILVGVLSAVLVVLLVISGTLINNDPTNPGSDAMNSVGSQGSSSALPDSTGSTGTTAATQSSSSAATQPTTVPATAPPANPTGGNYINVGSGYIAEVIQANVETFDGGKYDDYSHPTNNYLPEGTMDYCSEEIVYGSSMKYVQLRSGHRVYYDKKVYPFEDTYYKMIEEVKRYDGWLPDHNEIGINSFKIVGHHTVLTLDTLWKAPFYFKTNQSGYAKPNGGSGRDYEVVQVNATYVDITFCYTTVFTGTVNVPSGHPLFKSAEIIKNDSDYTLRLFLKKKGGFYGWHAYYNDNDQLCFMFLNPTKVTVADNKYGADLTGTKIMIDVGHGGLDGGAAVMYCPACNKDIMANTLKSGRCPTCRGKVDTIAEEADLNLMLANALKAELESVGATVVLNRTDDSIITINDRQEQFHEIAPDICIAIHQNSNDTRSVRGVFIQFFTTWSQPLAKKIFNYTKESGIYTRNFVEWKANYFLNRQPICPTILTENGFMSNAEDLAAMMDPVTVQNKAAAMVQGIADYFLEINK